MHRMVSHAVRCILWGSASPFPIACSLHYDSTIYALLKSAVIPNLRAAFCEFFHKVVKSSTNTHLSRPHAGAKAPAFWFMSCYAAIRNQYAPMELGLAPTAINPFVPNLIYTLCPSIFRIVHAVEELSKYISLIGSSVFRPR